MTNKQLLAHFRQLKTVNKLPNHFLIQGIENETNKTANEILKMLNCPLHNECLTNCQSCHLWNNNDEKVIMRINQEKSSILRQQIDDLRIWSRFHHSAQKNKFFLISNADLLTPSASNQLLKFLEESPPFIVGLFTSNHFYNLPKTLLSRLQIFTLNTSFSNLSSENSLSLSEQTIYKNLQKTSFPASQNFLNDVFLPLKKQANLFLRHLYQKNVDFFLLNSDEELLLKNFWIFLKMLVFQIKATLLNDRNFAWEIQLFRNQFSYLNKVLGIILKLLWENNNLFRRTKNSLSTKLAFLDFLYNLKRISK